MNPRTLALLTLLLASCSSNKTVMPVGMPVVIWSVADLEESEPFDENDWSYERVKQTFEDFHNRAGALNEISKGVGSELHRKGIDEASISELESWQARRSELWGSFYRALCQLQMYEQTGSDWKEFWNGGWGKLILSSPATTEEERYFCSLNADEAWEYLQRKAWSADAQLNSVLKDTGDLILAITEEIEERDVVQSSQSQGDSRLRAVGVQLEQGE